eukprot:360699-Chlamydomonas_euryale.AAC.2
MRARGRWRVEPGALRCCRAVGVEVARLQDRRYLERAFPSCKAPPRTLWGASVAMQSRILPSRNRARVGGYAAPSRRGLSYAEASEERAVLPQQGCLHTAHIGARFKNGRKWHVHVPVPLGRERARRFAFTTFDETSAPNLELVTRQGQSRAALFESQAALRNILGPAGASKLPPVAHK